ncbi:CrcB family protein [Streptomyces sp. TRM 70351]|uniref:fluoride efflux transporter FluC n=1 Tax=Streptomyces sp. TRM 70351 TaxID=3116552 RepID=UPI002E7BCB41|nr:CrcB family protein [Streptomyces sp. TRM 70351]MEE1929826.1 CrcB family protein [Streptomyces sp. TRM 70351]
MSPAPADGDGAPGSGAVPLPPAARAGAGSGRRWTVLGAVALGGALGGLARHGVQVLWPPGGPGFPTGTLLVNVAGCALLGSLMTLVAGRHPHPLVRPFLGVGVLGGFTSLSAYALDGALLLDAGALRSAVLYLAGTLVGALLAVWAGAALTRAVAVRT